MSRDRSPVFNLPVGSVLYVSAVISSRHPLHGVFRESLEPPPEIDLARIVDGAGSWVRQYFVPQVIDGTKGASVLPKRLDGYRGLVIGGSLHTCLTENRALETWQHDLLEFIRRSIFEWNLPFLGLCGGGQLGLLALGGRVQPNPAGLGRPDSPAGSLLVRTTEIHFTPDGRKDPIFKGCPSILPMLESHREWLAELPAGMRVLGASEDLPNQVLAWGDRVRLFQPHPELRAAYLRRILEKMSLERSDPEPLLEAAAKLRPTVAANRSIIRNFLSEICVSKP